jgi:RNA polymerase sigma-70 factor (ECF subfamily)
MSADVPENVTQLLRAWGDGDRSALDQLTPLVYAELKKSARRYMARENPGHTLQSTALINEVYLRLVDVKQVTWQNRAHFLGVCARMMRHILTDFARSRHYQKRGGDAAHITFDDGLIPATQRPPDLVALDEALNLLAQMDARKGQVVELRFFGGLTVQETAEVLHISAETVMRDWGFAKSWLLHHLSEAAS